MTNLYMSSPAADAVPGTENATRSVFQDIYLNEQDVINKQGVDVKSENIKQVPVISYDTPYRFDHPSVSTRPFHESQRERYSTLESVLNLDKIPSP